MNTSPAFQAFLEGLALPPSHAELHYPLQAVPAFSAADHQAAAALLIERIQENSDIRAVYTVAALGYRQAEAAVLAATEAASPVLRGAAQVALARLQGDTASLVGLQESLHSAQEGIRNGAAYELSRLLRLDASWILLEALVDPVMGIRVHAMEGLLRQLGLEALAEPRESPLSTLQVRLYTTLSTIYLPAAAQIRVLFVQLLQGASPESLGLVYVPASNPIWVTQFVRSMLRPEYRVDVLALFGPPERAWADAIILAALERQDARAVRALVALGAHEAVDVLRECLSLSPLKDDFKAAVVEALAFFREPVSTPP